MQKVRIICLKDAKYAIVSGLHKLGLVDLRKSELDLEEDEPLENYQSLSDQLIKVEGGLGILEEREIKKTKKISDKDSQLTLDKIGGQIDRIFALRDETQSISDDNNALGYAARTAAYFGGLNIDLGTLQSSVLAFRALVLDDKEFSKFKRHSKEKAFKSAEVMTNAAGKRANVVFVAYKKGDEQIEIALKDIGGIELDLKAKYLDSTPHKIIRSVSQKKSENAKRLSEIKIELSSLSDHYYPTLTRIRESLRIELSRAEVSGSFKRTASAFAIEGWVPKKRVEDLRAFLHRTTGNKFVLEMLKTSELAPTLVNRPKFLRPFDFMMEFFSVPRSDEIDPTWIFIITFPIFYGIMVSDVGYGIASGILSQLIIMKTAPDGLMNNTAKIWRMSSIPAIIVGLLTNQWFGLPLNNLFTNWQGVSWTGSITSIIVFTVIFGIIQVGLGFIFGFINEMKHGHKLLAISKITSILTLIFGTIAVGGMLFHAFGPTLSLYSVVIAVASLIVTLLTAGSEAAEIMNLITHPLSYARIMGFGLSSVIIASLVDKAFTPSLSQGPVVFVLFFALFIVLHFMNMILSMFEGIVQAARLNFVEFFSKFYKGAGTKYSPFSYKRVYTEE